jgi:uncharacterized protein YozE (UPF0346 family)
MRQKLMWGLCLFNLLFVFAYAEGNIFIEEIGTEPAELVEGMSIPLFATLSNRGDSQMEISLEFRLDSQNVSRHEGIVLKSGTLQKKFLSDYSGSISPGNMTIEVIAYSDGQEVARKSTQITVHERQDAFHEDEHDVVLFTLAAFGILFLFLVINVFLNRRRDFRFFETANRFSDEIRSFSREIEKQGEERRQEEDFKLISSYLAHVASFVEKLGNNNFEAAEIEYEKIKKQRGDISSYLKSMQKRPASHSQSQLIEELKELRVEVNRKEQFVDTLIPDFLLRIAEEKLHAGDIEGAKSIIFSARGLLNNEEVIQRLRKLREIGY